MLSLLLAGAVFAQGPARPEPVAMILEVQGAVTIKPAQGPARKPAAMQMLFPDDRLTSVEKGRITIVFLVDCHRERLKAGAVATIAGGGCQPVEAVDRQPPETRKAVSAGLLNLKVNERGAVKVFRGEQPFDRSIAAATPIPGSKVLTNSPNLAWLPVPGAQTYQVQMVIGGSNRQAWTKPVRTTQPRLSYPEKQKPLQRGRKYKWTVFADVGSDKIERVVDGEFSVASDSEAKNLEEVRKLAASTDSSDLLLAALAYHNEGALEPALEAFEKLARLMPAEPAFHVARAKYYERAGRTNDAKKAWASAKELGYTPPEEVK